MRKLGIIIACLAVSGAVGAAFAGSCGAAAEAGCGAQVKAASGCCPAAKAQTVQAGDCGKCLEGLDLTQAQKEKLTALKESCEGIACDKASAEKMKEGLAKVLTPEQLASLEASCKKSGCTAKKVAVVGPQV